MQCEYETEISLCVYACHMTEYAGESNGYI